MNPSITPEFVERFIDKPWYWGKDGLSSNPSITPEFVESRIDKPWDWSGCGLSRNPSVSVEFVERFIDKPWDWSKWGGLSSNTFEIANLRVKKQQDVAARIIQKGCYNWLFKPVCKDGTTGIFPRLSWRKLQQELETT